MAETLVEWYDNQRIFITGATGFMGKILVEKLLRSCPKIAAIYIMLRPKKGKEAKDRLKKFFDVPVFDLIRKKPNSQEIFDKVIGISGDTSKENCGLSDVDKSLLQDTVTLVFHMAADVRFTLPLKAAVLSNVGGALNTLELARTFKKLKAFVHVSTLYCHCDQLRMEEKMYKAPHNPRQILDLVTWMDETSLQLLTPQLLSNNPNTYAYTKCLAEALASEYQQYFPVLIARPSIVTAAAKEPIPGWLDNINGPTAVLVATGKGIMRSILCDPQKKVNIVPVDVSVNSLLVVAWKVASETRKYDVEVYHIMTKEEHCLSWKTMFSMLEKHYYKLPFSVCLWYPTLNLTTSRLVHKITVITTHYLPAYFVDFLLYLFRKKTFLVQTQKRISQGLEAFEYYTMRSWHFENEKLIKVYDGLCEADKETFYINRHGFDQNEYMRNYLWGTRHFCLKEDVDSIPRARKMLTRLYYIRVLRDVLLFALLIWFLYKLV